MTHPQDTTPANSAQGVSEAEIKAFREKYREIFPGSHPDRQTIIELLTASKEAVSAASEAFRSTLTAAIGAGGETVPAEWYATANKQRNEAEKNATHWHGEIEAIGAMLGIGAPEAGEVPAAVQAAIGVGGQAVAPLDDVAARMWKADAEDSGTPASVAARRTRDAFDDQAEELKARWRKIAKAASSALSQPHPADERVVEALPRPDAVSMASGTICLEYVDRDERDLAFDWLEAHGAGVALAASHMPVGDGDYFSLLVERARQAAEKASAKFPQPNYIALKIAEEAGEVVRGAVHYAENRMEWIEVEGEIFQLLAMIIRFVTEGDLVNGIVPPLAASTGEANHG